MSRAGCPRSRERQPNRSQIGFCPGQPWPKEGDLHWHLETTFKKTGYLRIQDRLFQTILDSSDFKRTCALTVGSWMDVTRSCWRIASIQNTSGPLLPQATLAVDIEFGNAMRATVRVPRSGSLPGALLYWNGVGIVEPENRPLHESTVSEFPEYCRIST